MKRRVGRRKLQASRREIYGACHVTRKVRFPDELTAKIEASKMHGNGKIMRGVYQCNHCSMWHLTSHEVSP